MEDHHGLVFRDGPSGRRAVLIGGPDVWEVVRAIRSARAAEPELDPDAVLDLVESNSGVPARLLAIALGYWAAVPDEVDALIAEADRAEADALAAWERQRELLAR
jgi:hypothetical protein